MSAKGRVKKVSSQAVALRVLWMFLVFLKILLELIGEWE